MVNRILSHYKLLGIVFLALVVLAVYGTYAIFAKKYVDYDRVTLETSTVGLQLPKRADVKVRGVIVGEVLDQSTTPDGNAELTLGMYPDKINDIPANVTASILPKTLFGEKFVSLVIPQDPSGQLAANDTITRTRVSTEVEAVLDDLYPLLRTVQPAQINMTLNAIATALEGRGNQLGDALITTDNYLKRLNPQIPQLLDDLRKTASVSDIYSDVLPQVGQILDNTVTTTGTLKTREQRLQAVFDDVSSLSDTLRTFLSDNGDNIVSSTQLGASTFRVLSRYSPEFPCLLKGIVEFGHHAAEAFRGFELHIVLETLPNQPRAYTPADKPVFGEQRGPNCLHLPNPPWSQANPVQRIPNFADGVDTPLHKGTDRVAPGFAGNTSGGFVSGAGYVGSAAENDLYRRLLSPSLGVPASDVGDLGGLLVGPMARGGEVTLR